MKLAPVYTKEIDKVLEQMASLKETCCLPVVTLYADGKMVNTDATFWTSENAKIAFDTLALRLKRLTEEQQKILEKDEVIQNEYPD
jgi:hypothetical protein